MSEIDQLIQQGERLIVEQKSSEAEGVARIIDSANLQRDWRLQHLNEDVSGDIIFKNLSQQIDAKYSSILNTLAGLTNQLKDMKNARASAASPCEFFWSIWRFWNEELFWHPDQKDLNGVWVIAGRNMGTQIIPLPEGFETWTVDSLAYLEKERQVLNEPDEYKPTDALAYTYYAAAYGLILFKQENSYSEESIRAFQESFRAYFSVYKSIGEGQDLPSLEDWYPLLDTEVQVPVGLHLFKIRVLQRDWQDALQMYAHTMACFSYAAITAIEIDSTTPAGVFWDSAEEGLHKEAQTVFDHIRELPQPPGDELWTEITRNVDLIIKAIKRYWGDDDAQLLSYWSGALWWLRGAKLEPDVLQRSLHKEADERAQQHLTRYFFNKDQWGALSQRARQALVDADRLWFAHRLGASDAPLIHIQMATEDIVRDLFDCELAGFENKLKLKDLKTDGFSKDEEVLIKKQLPCYLKRLVSNRNPATHSPGKPPLEDEREVAVLFNTFMGIGCEGVLPRLADLKLKLFPNKRPSKS